MKRIFAIIAVLAAALALPAIAGAADSETTGDLASEVTVESAIQLDVAAGDFSEAVTEANLEALDVAPDEFAIGFDQDVDLRSNAGWNVALTVGALTGSNGDSLSLDVSNPGTGSPNANNAYQAADTSAAGGVDWADNAGTYSGTASVTATNTY